MSTCEACGRPYRHLLDWSGCSTDDGLCDQCREANAEYARLLAEQEAAIERENPPVKCDYCGARGGSLNPVDPLHGWLAWIIWVATGRMSCGKPGCYSRAKRDSETAVQGMCDARIA